MDTKGAREARAMIGVWSLARCGSGAAEGDSLLSRGSAHKWDLERDLDLVRLDAWIIDALGFGLRAKSGQVAAPGAVQLWPILSRNVAQ
eukprot:scaffold77231_cov59-Phaeocystis_antarctica.AAC.1